MRFIFFFIASILSSCTTSSNWESSVIEYSAKITENGLALSTNKGSVLLNSRGISRNVDADLSQLLCDMPFTPIAACFTEKNGETSLYLFNKSEQHPILPENVIFLPNVFGKQKPNCISLQKDKATAYQTHEKQSDTRAIFPLFRTPPNSNERFNNFLVAKTFAAILLEFYNFSENPDSFDVSLDKARNLKAQLSQYLQKQTAYNFSPEELSFLFESVQFKSGNLDNYSFIKKEFIKKMLKTKGMHEEGIRDLMGASSRSIIHFLIKNSDLKAAQGNAYLNSFGG